MRSACTLSAPACGRCASIGASASRSMPRNQSGGQSQRVRPELAIGPARGRTRWAGPMTGSACPPGSRLVGTARRARLCPPYPLLSNVARIERSEIRGRTIHTATLLLGFANAQPRLQLWLPRRPTLWSPSGLLRQRLAYPLLDHVGNLVGVLLQHHHMAIAVNTHGAEIEPGRMYARLLQELHHAMFVGAVKRSLAGHDGDRQLLQIGQLPRRFLLQPALGEVRTVGLFLPLER